MKFTILRSTLSAFVLAGAAIAPVTAQSVDPDIAGFKLGLDVEQAPAKLAEINPDYQIRELQDNGKLVGLVGQLLNERRHTVDAMFVLASQDGKIAQMTRFQRPEQGERFMLSGLKEQLLEKYGPNMTATKVANIHTFQWQQMRDGASTDQAIKCQNGLGKVQAGNARLIFTEQFFRECGLKVLVTAIDDGQGLVEHFTVHISDDGKQSDEIRGEAQAQEDKAAKEREQAKSGKAKL